MGRLEDPRCDQDTMLLSVCGHGGPALEKLGGSFLSLPLSNDAQGPLCVCQA